MEETLGRSTSSKLSTNFWFIKVLGKGNLGQNARPILMMGPIHYSFYFCCLVSLSNNKFMKIHIFLSQN